MGIFVLNPVGRGVDYPHSRGITQCTKKGNKGFIESKAKKKTIIKSLFFKVRSF